MQVRHTARAVLTLLLLLPAAESGLALATQPDGPSETADANADSVANAPWFNAEVDTLGDTGQTVSVVIDQSLGDVYISYFDAINAHLRVAKYVGMNGNCGEKSDWQCHTLNSITGAGMYSSLAVRLGDIPVAYQDSAGGDLRYALGIFALPNNWTAYAIDKGVFPVTTGLYPSMRIQANSTRLISYHTSNPSGVDELRLAHYVHSGGNCGYGTTPGRWQCNTIHAGEGVG